ncbi:hypothetical protein GSI_07321 [Ganoderma sinense ZZ0214-1]|uniref:Uncharacterized protein n=1 Tax=Ganoderma sinense ZZ0214-1 TaxID=1077348 RepID=A0A2G8SA29_9APHY|nr:hypothetical protein GSI_07321 [Ganoderma sinense ZZ0214-1]
MAPRRARSAIPPFGRRINQSHPKTARQSLEGVNPARSAFWFHGRGGAACPYAVGDLGGGRDAVVHDDAGCLSGGQRVPGGFNARRAPSFERDESDESTGLDRAEDDSRTTSRLASCYILALECGARRTRGLGGRRFCALPSIPPATETPLEGSNGALASLDARFSQKGHEAAWSRRVLRRARLECDRRACYCLCAANL